MTNLIERRVFALNVGGSAGLSLKIKT